MQARATLLRKQDGEDIFVPVTIHVDKLMRPPVRSPGSSAGALRERACWPAALAGWGRSGISRFTPPRLAPLSCPLRPQLVHQ